MDRLTPFFSFRRQRGALAEGTHEFGYEAVLRHLGNLQPSASVSMREVAGQSVKSALFHTWTRDTRDDAIFGTRGAYLNLSQELAGFGGDASFYKAEGKAQLARPLLPGLVSMPASNLSSTRIY